MTDYTELKRLAEASLGEWYEVGELRCEDRSGYINGLHHDDEYFIVAANPTAVLALIAENERLAAKIEQVRSRSVSLDYSKDAVIPNALDAWGRVVPQHLPYDFSGNPGASATQYCNGWNDAGGYWKAHCVDIQSERDQLKTENDRLKAEVDSLTREADRQYTTIEAYRKDAERFQWLLKNASVILDKKTAYQAETGFIKYDTMPGRTETELAIDAAMGQGEQS